MSFISIRIILPKIIKVNIRNHKMFKRYPEGEIMAKSKRKIQFRELKWTLLYKHQNSC